MELIVRMVFILVAVSALLSIIPSADAQSISPAPAPSNDGVAIDQGIAYALMLVALALTYIIH